MVKRTETFSVGGVKLIGLLHLLPTSKVLDGSLGASVSVEVDVEKHVVASKSLDVNGHEIVNLVNSQLHVERLSLFVVYDDADVGYFLLLLYGQQQVFACYTDSLNGMALTQYLRSLGICRHGHQHKGY